MCLNDCYLIGIRDKTIELARCNHHALTRQDKKFTTLFLLVRLSDGNVKKEMLAAEYVHVIPSLLQKP